MTIAICTLFEGDYHHGVAALANSLHASGFTGTLYAGYRGPRPAWAAADDVSAAGVRVHLLPLVETIHLTNFKPQFIRRVFAEHAPSANAVLFLDSDICVAAPWRFVETWLDAGVALCEDVNSPLYENHPRRFAWRKFYARHAVSLRHRGDVYVNGGAVGVTRARLGFVETWERVQDLMGAEIGGLAQAKLDGGTSKQMRDPFYCFNATDQDALNATLEACADTPVSILGREAMGFVPGLLALPHALGSRKPWRRNYLLEALSGRQPGPADDAFWRHASGPLSSWPAGVPARRRRQLRAARLIGRFIRAA